MLLKQCDLDQGSSGAVLFNQFVVGGGKDGEFYFMRTDKMARLSARTVSAARGVVPSRRAGVHRRPQSRFRNGKRQAATSTARQLFGRVRTAEVGST